jgi:heptosyltransferase-2
MATDPLAIPGPPSLIQPHRLLVRGVNWLGDAVMTTPALQRLRQRFPDAHITLFTDEKLVELWRNHPSLDEVLTFSRGENPWSVGRRLQAQKFDTALVLPNSIRSALEVWWARVPQRIGYANPWRDLFLTQRVPARPGHRPMRKLSTREIKRLISLPTSDGNRASRIVYNASGSGTPPPDPHHIHQYLHLAAVLGTDPAPLPPHLTISPEELETSRSKFGLGADSRPIVGLSPGAEYGPAKRWPVARFIEAARAIRQQRDCIWLLLGGSADRQTADAIFPALNPGEAAIHNLAGKTSLRELMALLKTCRVLLTNDSGPMHVAAALGTPVVVPFGSTSHELTGPGLPRDPNHHLLNVKAPCSPCFRRICPIDFRCMNGIRVDQVVQAVLDAMGPG